jgi:hypothetical protein
MSAIKAGDLVMVVKTGAVLRLDKGNRLDVCSVEH